MLTHPTRLIGRAAELASLVELLQHTETRLITITGPGGCGKTRLAAEVASLAATHFAGGAVLVELAPLRDASRFTSAIADALDIQDVGARPLLDSVLSTLATLDLLMVLDNFEHILGAAPIVATLLETCPRLTVLATSREPLHLRWEQRFPLAPLALATADEAADPRRLERVPACSLFLERARAVNPTLVISPSEAPAKAEICARLDGLPLAIELAAARTNILSPSALL
ncbi:MAG: AAA family ATPase, partial [Chloroflexi bacterium]|nr:AAA family ATPase [Chloroflexota bacterium]